MNPPDQLNPSSCITIVDDDGRFMIDRKLLLEAKNQSHQAKVRKLLTQSRKIYGQQTQSDLSNQLSEQQIANKLISQENSIVFEKSRPSQGQTIVVDGNNNSHRDRQHVAVNTSNISNNIEPRSGSILKIDKNNLKIKYVTEQNSSKKAGEQDDCVDG